MLQSYVKVCHFKRINTSDKTPIFTLPFVLVGSANSDDMTQTFTIISFENSYVQIS